MVSGVSFHKSPVEVRERVSIASQRLPEALRFVIDQPGVRECMVLSTCNRTELYLSADPWLDARDLFVRMVGAIRDYDLSSESGQVYQLRGSAAVTHLFRVAASLDSLVVGEPQILGQTKAAFREAETQGCVDRDLHRLIPRAFAAAKQVRSDTGICDAAVSVSYAAVQLARKIFERLTGKNVVVLGAGKMSELAALHLREAGASSIVVANRTLERAEQLATRCSGLAVEFERRFEQIAAADVVICSTDAPHFVLAPENVTAMMRTRPERPLLILDIAVPRQVDPRVAELDAVYLFNIDDLEGVVNANREGRRLEGLRAEAIVQSALEKFLVEENQSQVAPAISAIRNQVRAICMSELERLEQRLPALSAEDREELQVMLHRIAQKIVHPAIMELKAAAPNAAPAKLSLVEKLFGVDRRTSLVEP
jgi:glutamyl-tRNA reductase